MAKLFNKPCQLHLRLPEIRQRPEAFSNRETRHWIDDRFYTEMKRECDGKYDDWLHIIDGQDEACHSEALLMYKAAELRSFLNAAELDRRPDPHHRRGNRRARVSSTPG